MTSPIRPDSVVIRRATAVDIPALMRLNAQVQNVHASAMPHIYKPMRHDAPVLRDYFHAHFIDGDYEVFVAEVDGEVIGYLMCLVRDITANVYIHAYTDLHINQMGVDENHRGRGIGSALLDHAIDHARGLGLHAVSLGVAAFNTDAIRLYQRHGFELRSHSLWRAL